MNYYEKINILSRASTSSKRVTLVPIFFGKNQSHAPLFLLFRKKPRLRSQRKKHSLLPRSVFSFSLAYHFFAVTAARKIDGSLVFFIREIHDAKALRRQLPCLKRLSGNFCSVFYPFLQKVILAVPAHLFACRSQRLYAVLLLFAGSITTVKICCNSGA